MNKKADHCTTLTFKYSEIKNFDFVMEKIYESLRLRGVDIDDLRLFNQQGLELFEQDLQFIKTGDILYVSKGEDFDILTYYDEYQIVKELGEGGFGSVVLGIHKKTQEKVAIKITSAEAIDTARDVYIVFAEAETLKNLKHSNIVTMHNCFLDKKSLRAYFIMEYLEGGELLGYVSDKGHIEEKEALHIFKQLIDAIDYCHQCKIIHRDLKLENILRVSSDSDQFKVRKNCLINFGRLLILVWQVYVQEESLKLQMLEV